MIDKAWKQWNKLDNKVKLVIVIAVVAGAYWIWK